MRAKTLCGEAPDRPQRDLRTCTPRRKEAQAMSCWMVGGHSIGRVSGPFTRPPAQFLCLASLLASWQVVQSSSRMQPRSLFVSTFLFSSSAEILFLPSSCIDLTADLPPLLFTHSRSCLSNLSALLAKSFLALARVRNKRQREPTYRDENNLAAHIVSCFTVHNSLFVGEEQVFGHVGWRVAHSLPNLSCGDELASGASTTNALKAAYARNFSLSPFFSSGESVIFYYMSDA